MKRFQTPCLHYVRIASGGSERLLGGMAIFGGMVALSKRTSRKHRV
jgi:hypothetical protein